MHLQQEPAHIPDGRQNDNIGSLPSRGWSFVPAALKKAQHKARKLLRRVRPVETPQKTLSDDDTCGFESRTNTDETHSASAGRRRHSLSVESSRDPTSSPPEELKIEGVRKTLFPKVFSLHKSKIRKLGSPRRSKASRNNCCNEKFKSPSPIPSTDEQAAAPLDDVVSVRKRLDESFPPNDSQAHDPEVGPEQQPAENRASLHDNIEEAVNVPNQSEEDEPSKKYKKGERRARKEKQREEADANLIGMVIMFDPTAELLHHDMEFPPCIINKTTKLQKLQQVEKNYEDSLLGKCSDETSEESPSDDFVLGFHLDSISVQTEKQLIQQSSSSLLDPSDFNTEKSGVSSEQSSRDEEEVEIVFGSPGNSPAKEESCYVECLEESFTLSPEKEGLNNSFLTENGDDFFTVEEEMGFDIDEIEGNEKDGHFFLEGLENVSTKKQTPERSENRLFDVKKNLLLQGSFMVNHDDDELGIEFGHEDEIEIEFFHINEDPNESFETAALFEDCCSSIYSDCRSTFTPPEAEDCVSGLENINAEDKIEFEPDSTPPYDWFHPDHQDVEARKARNFQYYLEFLNNICSSPHSKGAPSVPVFEESSSDVSEGNNPTDVMSIGSGTSEVVQNLVEMCRKSGERI